MTTNYKPTNNKEGTLSTAQPLQVTKSISSQKH